MSATTLVPETGVVEDAFDLDVQVETQPMRIEDAACNTDDGCGSTCEISACHSQK